MTTSRSTLHIAHCTTIHFFESYLSCMLGPLTTTGQGCNCCVSCALNYLTDQMILVTKVNWNKFSSWNGCLLVTRGVSIFPIWETEIDFRNVFLNRFQHYRTKDGAIPEIKCYSITSAFSQDNRFFGERKTLASVSWNKCQPPQMGRNLSARVLKISMMTKASQT